jgi:hypothetical protein
MATCHMPHGFQLASPAVDVSKKLYGKIADCMGRPSVQYDIFNFAQFLIAKVEYVLHLGVIQLNPGLRNTWMHQIEVMVVYVWTPYTNCDVYHKKFKTHLDPGLELKCRHLGTKIAIIFSFFRLGADFHHRLCKIASKMSQES